ncbi:MAG: hypothetical protein LUE93_13205 [Bacteroides sp.]|nr:hypothetical protein [Bacteroides sp.]
MEEQDDFLMEDFDFNYDEIIAYIRVNLPQELKDRFTDDQLTYIIDTIDDYYIDSDIINSEPDEEGYVTVDLEKLADYIVKEAAKDEIGTFEPEEILLVVQAEMDFEESQIPE